MTRRGPNGVARCHFDPMELNRSHYAEYHGCQAKSRIERFPSIHITGFTRRRNATDPAPVARHGRTSDGEAGDSPLPARAFLGACRRKELPADDKCTAEENIPAPRAA